MPQAHPPVTPTAWPVAPTPSFLIWTPPPRPPKPAPVPQDAAAPVVPKRPRA